MLPTALPRFLTFSLLALSANAWVLPNFGLGSTTRFATPVVAPADQIDQVREVLALARELGPVGAFRTTEEQEKILQLARSLQKPKQAPTSIPLDGIHNLVYSAAPGGSSGKIGPFAGKVTQEFVNSTAFINAVELGPLKLALQARREIVDGNRINVFFLETKLTVLGVPVLEKPASGGGQWKYLWAGVIPGENGKKKLIRIMETPSLFVIEQDLDE